MFAAEYNVLGTVFRTVWLKLGRTVRIETELYPYIKNTVQANGYMYNRIETPAQDGVPDILITQGMSYSWIEVKRLTKPKLQVVEDDLKWQFGQLGFLKRCAHSKTAYVLAVVKQDNLCLLHSEILLPTLLQLGEQVQ